MWHTFDATLPNPRVCSAPGIGGPVAGGHFPGDTAAGVAGCFSMTSGHAGEATHDRTVFGHPLGLTNLFGVELWERFSYYGMLTILGYYLYYSATDGGLGLPQATATE